MAYKQDRRERLRYREEEKRAAAKLTAAKIIGLYFDRATPTFLTEAILTALFKAAGELGLLDDSDGYWPNCDDMPDEIAKDLRLVEAICLASGPNYELKGGTR